jgi:hypothetical protein
LKLNTSSAAVEERAELRLDEVSRVSTSPMVSLSFSVEVSLRASFTFRVSSMFKVTFAAESGLVKAFLLAILVKVKPNYVCLGLCIGQIRYRI